nr:hypothetical protein GCM10020093_067520 [Planobispora longispora]
MRSCSCDPPTARPFRRGRSCDPTTPRATLSCGADSLGAPPQTAVRRETSARCSFVEGNAVMSAARVGVVTFPGTLDDQDAARAVRHAGGEAVPLWHADPDLKGVDAVFLPGGFSYGDYLRCGAISRFAPLMEELIPAARAGLPVLGTCNGFQILCEAHLLPGALMRNASLHYICRDQGVVVENTATPGPPTSPRARGSCSRSSTARAATSPTRRPSRPWRRTARSSSATSGTPTAP